MLVDAMVIVLLLLFCATVHGLSLQRVGPVPGSIDVTTSMDIVGCDTSGSNTPIVNLPPAAAQGGYAVTIADETGNAATGMITINAYGDDTIDGFASPFVIAQNWMVITLYADGGSNWICMGVGRP